MKKTVNKKNRPIMCNETKERFKTIAEASYTMGLPASAISAYLCNAREAPVQGHTFSYLY